MFELAQTGFLVSLFLVGLWLLRWSMLKRLKEPQNETEALARAIDRLDNEPAAERGMADVDAIREYLVNLHKLRQKRKKEQLVPRETFIAGEIGNRRMGVRKDAKKEDRRKGQEGVKADIGR